MESFVVRPITAGGWDQIAAALVQLFARLRATGEGHCVVVEVAEDRYVQFIARPDGSLWTESIGDVYLDDGFDDGQRRQLERLGWSPPELFGLGHGNYWREYETPGHDGEAVAVAILTCIEVFETDPRTKVLVRVFEAVGSHG
jgi:hypothetical protein